MDLSCAMNSFSACCELLRRGTPSVVFAGVQSRMHPAGSYAVDFVPCRVVSIHQTILLGTASDVAGPLRWCHPAACLPCVYTRCHLDNPVWTMVWPGQLAVCPCLLGWFQKKHSLPHAPVDWVGLPVIMSFAFAGPWQQTS